MGLDIEYRVQGKAEFNIQSEGHGWLMRKERIVWRRK